MHVIYQIYKLFEDSYYCISNCYLRKIAINISDCYLLKIATGACAPVRMERRKEREEKKLSDFTAEAHRFNQKSAHFISQVINCALILNPNSDTTCCLLMVCDKTRSVYEAPHGGNSSLYKINRMNDSIGHTDWKGVTSDWTATTSYVSLAPEYV